MMDFSAPRRAPNRSENIIPMINVGFLLLMFFMLSAQVAPPDPFDVKLPFSEASSVQAEEDTLFVAADGSLGYAGLTDENVWPALNARSSDDPLSLRADAGLDASKLAALLPKLAQAGIPSVLLVTGKN